MSVWDKLFPTRAMVSDVQATVWGIKIRIDEMGKNMADVSNELNQVAEGLRDRLGPRLSELLAENARLSTRNAELEGEDVAESAAAANVRTEWDNLVGILEPVSEVPTPEPLPEAPAEAPAEGVSEGPAQG